MRKETTKNNPFKVGDIVCFSWGHSMTLVQFYEVTRVTKCKVGLVELHQRETYIGYLSGETMPVVGEYELDSSMPYGVSEDKLYCVKPGPRGHVIRVPAYPGDRCRSAILWDGKPKYFDYCD